MAGSKVDKEELRKIKIIVHVTPKVNNISSDESSKEIKRDIISVDDVIVKRKPEEGSRPLFDRMDIKVNRVKIKIDYANISTNKDINFNLSRQSPFSQTTREVSKVTEEGSCENSIDDILDSDLKPIHKNIDKPTNNLTLTSNNVDQSLNNNLQSKLKTPRKRLSKKAETFDEKMDLVKNYIDQLGEMNGNKHPHKNRSRKRHRSNSSSSSYSNDSSIERQSKSLSREREKLKGYKSLKRTRKHSPNPSENRRSIGKYARSKRYSRSRSSSLNRSISSITSNETLRDYKEYFDRRSYDKYKGKSNKKYECGCRECETRQLMMKNEGQSSSYSFNNDGHSKNKQEQKICSKRNRSRDRSSKNCRKRRQTSYSKDYYTDVATAEEDDVELKYHRYNAAMYAVSVILEIIKQHQ